MCSGPGIVGETISGPGPRQLSNRSWRPTLVTSTAAFTKGGGGGVSVDPDFNIFSLGDRDKDKPKKNSYIRIRYGIRIRLPVSGWPDNRIFGQRDKQMNK